MSHGPLRKYGLLHEIVAAPRDGSGAEMWLEVVGRLVRTVDPLEWRRLPWNERIQGPIEIVIGSATYSNEKYSGAETPFYI